MVWIETYYLCLMVLSPYSSDRPKSTIPLFLVIGQNVLPTLPHTPPTHTHKHTHPRHHHALSFLLPAPHSPLCISCNFRNSFFMKSKSLYLLQSVVLVSSTSCLASFISSQTSASGSLALFSLLPVLKLLFLHFFFP